MEVSQDVWFKKTANQKEACIRKFRNAKMSSTNESPPPYPRNSSSSNSSERQRIQISVDFGGVQSALPTTLQHTLEKAENLLNKDGVISETMLKPHYVCVAKNGKATCNDFLGWNA